MEDTKSGDNAETPTTKPRRSACIRFIAHIEREFHKYKSKKEKGSATDRMARTTATATVWIAAFTVILAAVGIFTLREVIKGGTAATRPWVGFEQSEAITPNEFIPNQKTAHLAVEYKLLNYGHSPAYVFLHSQIKDIRDNKDSNWLQNTVREECQVATQTLETRRPLTLLPNVPTPYTIVYGGAEGQDATGVEHMEDIDEPYGFNGHTATNVGCIAYQSTSDSAIRHTPFMAFFYFKDSKTRPEINGPYVIGDAN